MQLLQAWSTTGALLILLLGATGALFMLLLFQQAVGATKKGAEENGATVVIHVGPHKTGTTTIQSELASQASLLQVDGWTFHHDGLANKSHHGSHCYMGTERERHCKHWLKSVAMFKEKQNKVVMSDEGWCMAADLGQLASDLSELTTIIVMYYRPFYEWIASLYREHAKEYASPTRFAKWLSNETMHKYAFGNWNYVTSVYRRYAAHFSDVRVHIMGPSLMTDIVCDDLNASQTCSWFRAAKIGKENARTKGSEAGKCLNPAQQQELERLSVYLHWTAFGIVSPPPFPTSDFHDQASHCFGTR